MKSFVTLPLIWPVDSFLFYFLLSWSLQLLSLTPVDYSNIIPSPYHLQQQELARCCQVIEDISGDYLPRHEDAVTRHVIQRGADLPLDIQQPKVKWDEMLFFTGGNCVKSEYIQLHFRQISVEWNSNLNRSAEHWDSLLFQIVLWLPPKINGIFNYFNDTLVLIFRFVRKSSSQERSFSNVLKSPLLGGWWKQMKLPTWFHITKCSRENVCVSCVRRGTLS